FVATGNAVLQAGFKPVCVDIEETTLNIDTAKIEKAISEKTRAIMPVHLMGKPAAMDEIEKIAQKHNLKVIEDAAEAHGAIYKGKNIGAWGDLAAYSLYVAHIISTVEGGIIVTGRSDFADVLRSLRSHGRFCKCRQCVLNLGTGECAKRFKDGVDQRFLFERIGYSSKMNELEAAIGIGNLDIYRQILDKRRSNLNYWTKEFKRFEPRLKTIKQESFELIGPHAFPVILSQNAGFSREEFVGFLEARGIDTRTLFSSIPTQCEGFKFLRHKLGDFPNAEYIGERAIHVGVHQDLEKQHLDYFLDVVDEFLKGKE
ncbi:MAG: DegT/DnrJ/EryC1/StrS family aminotransferase, partial [Candidatus Omnitrophica bacterium]|nr:DegT/DnrJ/EryC1/StrS family aminotransferase [Candidatus Omnitrophota bacterium]